MFDIDGTLVSLDLVERFFCCDLDTCLGACCIEGDSVLTYIKYLNVLSHNKRMQPVRAAFSDIVFRSNKQYQPGIQDHWLYKRMTCFLPLYQLGHKS